MNKNIFGIISIVFFGLMLFASSETELWKWFLGLGIIFLIIWIYLMKFVKLDNKYILIFSLALIFIVLFLPQTSDLWRVFLFGGIILFVWWLIKRFW
jgi:hypothetical protein